MKHLFIPYELALLAKEKGFDKECIAEYEIENKQFGLFLQQDGIDILSVKNSDQGTTFITAPLYQQIIDWFRVKDIHIIIRPGFGATTWYDWRIVSKEHEDVYAERDEGYEEIEKCYNKAIEQAFKLINKDETIIS